MKRKPHEDFKIVNGKTLWSISVIAGSIINDEKLNRLRGYKGNIEMDRILNETGEWGTALHEVAKKIIDSKGFFVSKSTDPVLNNLENKFSVWSGENVIDMKFFEKEMTSMKYLYKGRMDGVYLLKGEKDFDLCDIKTGTNRHWAEALKMAAYKNLCIENGIKVNRRIIIECKRNDQPCKIVPVKTNYKSDFTDFLYAKRLFLRSQQKSF